MASTLPSHPSGAGVGYRDYFKRVDELAAKYGISPELQGIDAAYRRADKKHGIVRAVVGEKGGGCTLKGAASKMAKRMHELKKQKRGGKAKGKPPTAARRKTNISQARTSGKVNDIQHLVRRKGK